MELVDDFSLDRFLQEGLGTNDITALPHDYDIESDITENMQDITGNSYTFSRSAHTDTCG